MMVLSRGARPGEAVSAHPSGDKNKNREVELILSQKIIKFNRQMKNNCAKAQILTKAGDKTGNIIGSFLFQADLAMPGRIRYNIET